MASTLRASLQGIEIVDRARRHKGWNKTEVAWQVRADVSKSSLDRFWMKQPIKHQNFVSICEAVGVDWEQVHDFRAIESSSLSLKRGSNLKQVDQPVFMELEEFAQQIFEWFEVLGFKFEGRPRRLDNYAEWIIEVPQRRAKFDRVLIRTIIHEAGLADLDSLRRLVKELGVKEGWLVTNLWVSQGVKQALKRSENEKLTCQTFDELIDQDANFTPYIEWLEQEIGKKELDLYYVDLGCQKSEFDADHKPLPHPSVYSVADGGIDFYIDRWLESADTAHISILGEFGTGKTWFTLHYAGKCLQAYQDAKAKGTRRPRLPLVIPLRDYAKALTVESLFSEFFFRKHEIDLPGYSVFEKLNQMGKLLLIFDGFDEMADRVNPQKMINNFWELTRAVSVNAKVILTCRHEHFPTAQKGREILRGELMASTANLTGVPPQFETLELLKFDDKQIREALSRRTDAATVELVMENADLMDLLQRAVMTELVLEAVPAIEAGKRIENISQVYLHAVWRKMERDITTGRTFTSLADKLYFLCELAWEMLNEDKTKSMSLNYLDFPGTLQRLFPQEVKEQKHLDHWHYDMMNQTMLIRDNDGDYRPAHRSLLEFFAAYKLAAELGLLADDFLELARSQLEVDIDRTLPPKSYTWSEYWQRETDELGQRKPIALLSGFIRESSENLRKTFGKSSLTRAVLDLLKPALKLDLKYRDPNPLIELIQSTQAADVDYSGGNAATILVELEANALEYHNLSGTNLAYANLVNAGLKGTDLSGTNLENCLTTRVFGTPNAIVMSKDDLQVITAHDDNTIRIWDRASGRELQRLAGHQNSVNTIALSGDGRSLYSGSTDETIKEWNLADGSCRRTFEGRQNSVTTIALSGDGRSLYSSDDKTIKEWDLADGICRRTFAGRQNSVRTIALSGDGRSLYSGSHDETIKEWDLADGSCRRTFEGHQDSVTTIALSRDGRSLYSGSHDETIKEWDLADGSCRRTFAGHQGWVRTIALSGDGRSLYSGSHDKTIKEWDLSDGICRRTFAGHQDSVWTIALSGDELLLYCSDDKTIKEWDLADGSCRRTFAGHRSFVITISLSGDGLFLYSGSHDGTIKEWDLADGSCRRTFVGHQDWVGIIALSGDGLFLYSGSHDGTIKEWDLADDSCRRTFVGHQDWVGIIALSEDGLFLYSGSRDDTIKEWDLADGSCRRTFAGHQSSVTTIAISEDGLFLYSGSVDNTIKEWDLADGSCRRTFAGHQSSVTTIAMSGDGLFLYSGSDDQTIKEWDLADGSCRQTFAGQQGLLTMIALSGDGQSLYSGSHDGTIKEWDLADGSCRRTFAGHQGLVMTIALSGDGRSLYSGGSDDTIVWDVVSGEEVISIDHRLCAGANITNVKGLTPAQTDSLIALGAFSDD
jgi:WD40 repeat protein